MEVCVVGTGWCGCGPCIIHCKQQIKTASAFKYQNVYISDLHFETGGHQIAKKQHVLHNVALIILSLLHLNTRSKDLPTI